MKYLLLLLLAPVNAAAQANVQNVHEVALTTMTITQTIQLTTAVTDVTAATSSGTLSGAFAVEVYAVSTASSTIVCGQDSSLSATLGAPFYGREVLAGTGLYYAVPPSTRKTYCRGLQASGTVPVTITQFK